MADSRSIAVTTPLGPDVLFLASFRGREQISQPFHFQLDLLAENQKKIAFDKLLGQMVTIAITLPDGKTKRFWNGICTSLAEVGRDTTFTTYRMEMAPQLWLLSRRVQSRIFQHITVPDILKKVLAGLEIKLELQGTFEKRDYCVQYRESDFAFASRLMEEEGIYYFFKHTEGSHPMVLGNSPVTHPAVMFAEKAIYEEVIGGNRPDGRVTRWEKSQELRSGKVTLWDHCFELPNQHLEAERPTVESVEVGKVAHKLKLPANDALEIYEYPGGYAGRFDGIDRGGGEQPANLQKIFEDNKRTVAIRMEEEAGKSLLIRGASYCRNFMTGHKFTLERHCNADGPYVLVSVEHTASSSAATSGKDDGIVYSNHFTCIPLSLPFRPPQTTPRPKVAGLQTAVVVGPPGEEIHTDKYSRVKVQFPWDREGKHDDNSSCWIRVATIWAGKGYGVIHIPRIGHEVVVDFLEGDPDQPIIIGSVYNAENMPGAALPKNKMVSGLRSANYPGAAGFNGMVCDDTKSKQKVSVHAQHDMDTTVQHNDTQTVNVNREVTVHGTMTETIDQDTKITITKGTLEHTVATGTATYTVKGDLTETYLANQTTGVTGEQATTAGKKISVTSTGAEIVLTAATQIKLIVGSSSLVMDKSGKIELKGTEIFIKGSQTVNVDGDKVTITGGSEAKMGVSSQNVTCDPSKVAVTGAAINASAVGMHEITGALVKIN